MHKRVVLIFVLILSLLTPSVSLAAENDVYLNRVDNYFNGDVTAYAGPGTVTWFDYEIMDVASKKKLQESDIGMHTFSPDFAQRSSIYKVRARIQGTDKWTKWKWAIPSPFLNIIEEDDITKDSVSLSWEAVRGATSYDIIVSYKGGDHGYKVVANTTDTSYKLDIDCTKMFWVSIRPKCGKHASKMKGCTVYRSVKYSR